MSDDLFEKNNDGLTEPSDIENINPIDKDEDQDQTNSSPLFDSQNHTEDLNLNDQSIESSNYEVSPKPLIDLESRVEVRVLEDEMQSSYLKYAMSVIASRALPDVRDGLKPVHRRIIYVMNKMGLTPGGRYRKSAQVVGEVLGKYHPHGDVAVYNALARLAQSFSVRYELIDGQGNFGSVDGDAPAAMRYTECKLTRLATYLTSDIEKDTVGFVDNYDGSQVEPKVLPTRIPQLLINGSTGIAVGMATNIPPHNLNEVNNAIIHLIDNPEATVDDLMNFIKGPDFPTGGTLFGVEDIKTGYTTGRGRCILRAKATLTENSIIVTEIPYLLNKSDLVIKIADLVKDKRIIGIKDIRDESNKDGIRIVIETKREASPEVILNQLYQMSDLQMSVNFNLLALVNDGRQPKLLNLIEILKEFIAHRYDVVTRRTKHDLRKAEDELHILDGLKIALDHIDEVIKIIRGSYDKEEASTRLQERFELSQKQAEAILQMRLQTLTNLDKSKIENERQEKLLLISKLREILDNPEVMKTLIKTEIEEINEKFQSKRRTEIVAQRVGDYNKEDTIVEEDVLIQLTNSQYIKVLPVSTFRTQGRGGRGVTSFNPKEEDWVKASMIANTHDYLYAFTSSGRVFRTRVFDLPSGSRIGRGQALINYLQLRDDETITNILTLNKEQETNKEGNLIFATKFGIVKRTGLSDFNNVRKTGIIATTLKEGDQVVSVELSLNPNDSIILSASNGKTCIFKRDQLSLLGRTAQGVKGIKLKPKEYLISLQISDFEFAEAKEDETDSGELIEDNNSSKEKQYPSLIVITKNGFGKQTFLGEYRRTNRAASGVKTLNITKKTSEPVLVAILTGKEENIIITTKNGVTIRTTLDEINQLGRNTQGVKVIKLDDNDEVVSGSVL